MFVCLGILIMVKFWMCKNLMLNVLWYDFIFKNVLVEYVFWSEIFKVFEMLIYV